MIQCDGAKHNQYQRSIKQDVKKPRGYILVQKRTGWPPLEQYDPERDTWSQDIKRTMKVRADPWLNEVARQNRVLKRENEENGAVP